MRYLPFISLVIILVFSFTTLSRKQLYGQTPLALSPGLYTLHCLVMVIIREVVLVLGEPL